MPPVKHVYAIVLLAGILHALPVWSATGVKDSTPAAPDNTFGNIEDLHARNLVLQAELQGAELTRSLAEARTPSDTLPPSVSTDPGRPVSVRHQVLSITGRGDHLLASVKLRDGRVANLRRGSTFPDTTLTVTSLGAEGVTLSDGTLITF